MIYAASSKRVGQHFGFDVGVDFNQCFCAIRPFQHKAIAVFVAAKDRAGDQSGGAGDQGASGGKAGGSAQFLRVGFAYGFHCRIRHNSHFIVIELTDGAEFQNAAGMAKIVGIRGIESAGQTFDFCHFDKSLSFGLVLTIPGAGLRQDLAANLLALDLDDFCGSCIWRGACASSRECARRVTGEIRSRTFYFETTPGWLRDDFMALWREAGGADPFAVQKAVYVGWDLAADGGDQAGEWPPQALRKLGEG